jgi:hypothetical protein
MYIGSQLCITRNRSVDFWGVGVFYECLVQPHICVASVYEQLILVFHI